MFLCVLVCVSLVNALVRCERRPLRSRARNVILGCGWGGVVAAVSLGRYVPHCAPSLPLSSLLLHLSHRHPSDC